MATAPKPSPPPAAEKLDDDSAIAILRHLEEERGKMFTKAEYQEIRATFLEELAHRARIRPFTVFTFGIVLLGLFALLLIGLINATSRAAGDYTLAVVSAAALLATGYFL
jgi:hypothetical protein